MRVASWGLLIPCAVVAAAAAVSGLHPMLDTLGVGLLYATGGAVLCLIGFAASRSRRGTAAATLVGAGALAILAPHLGWGEQGNDLRLFQHNVLYTNDAAGLAEQIAEADIVTLQEVEAAVPTLEALPPDWTVQLCGNRGVGAPAILTRLPVSGQGCFHGGAFLRVEVGGTTVTFVSLHLYLPWPWEQPEQMDRILDDLRTLPRPVVVAGDFNQTTWSHAVNRVEAATGTKLIRGIDVTHIRYGGLVRLPIDHLLLPEGWIGQTKIGPRHGSDHRVLLGRIGIER